MMRVAMARGMVFNRAKGGGLGADPSAAARLAGVTPEWYVGVTSRLHLNAFRVEIPAIVGDDHSHAHSRALARERRVRARSQWRRGRGVRA